MAEVQQRDKGRIAAQRLGHRGPQRGGIIRVHPANGLRSALGGERDLVGHHVVGGVSLGHPLAHELAKKNPGKGKHHQEHQSGDREHKLGLQSHGGVTRTLLVTYRAVEQFRNSCIANPDSPGAFWRHRTACGFPRRKPPIAALGQCRAAGNPGSDGDSWFSQGEPPPPIFTNPMRNSLKDSSELLSQKVTRPVLLPFRCPSRCHTPLTCCAMSSG